MGLAGAGASGECSSLAVEEGLNVAALLTGADGIGVNGLCATIDGSGVGGLLSATGRGGVGGLFAIIGKGGVSGLFPAGADGIKPRLDNIPLLLKGVFADAGETSLTCPGGIPGAAVGIDCCGILSDPGSGGGTICCCIAGTGGIEGAIDPAYWSALIGTGGIEGMGAAGPAY
jgi:hypothetical protein